MDGFHVIVTIAEIEPNTVAMMVIARCDSWRAVYTSVITATVCNPGACFLQVPRTFRARKAG